MPCPPEIAEIVGRILSTGLLRIRAEAWGGNVERCAIEADHLHNLPALLSEFRPELLDYYWRVERVLFIEKSPLDDIAAFEPIWESLVEHLPATTAH